MPSTESDRTLTKRQLLAVCGSCAGAGALGGYAYGSGLLSEADRDPTPLDISAIDWPLPHYDGGNTRTVPSGNGSEGGLSERWRIDARRVEQPVVINGSVIVASVVPSAENVRAYDLRTGEKRWTGRVAFSGTRPSLAAGGDSLFVGRARSGEETVSMALATADGSERWTSGVASAGATVVLDEGVLVFEDSGDLTAIDARSGETCWQRNVPMRLRTSVVHAGRTVVTDTVTDGGVLALDARTGEKQWEADASEYLREDDDSISDGFEGHAVAGTDRVFLSTFGGMLIALDATTGETDWVTPEDPPALPTEGGRQYLPPGFEPIAFAGDSLLAVESDGTDRSDRLSALDPTTGDERWTFDPEASEGASVGSVAVAGETAFLPVADRLHLVDIASGEVLETHSLGDEAQSVTLADDRCLVATYGGLVAFERRS